MAEAYSDDEDDVIVVPGALRSPASEYAREARPWSGSEPDRKHPAEKPKAVPVKPLAFQTIFSKARAIDPSDCGVPAAPSPRHKRYSPPLPALTQMKGSLQTPFHMLGSPRSYEDEARPRSPFPHPATPDACLHTAVSLCVRRGCSGSVALGLCARTRSARAA